ncbi:DUF4232 domain-containing protein [Actinomadura livida]|uniref:DUF4232 domain-containing protein n=1 Tax=Actinomadura livida TaxID=79909 RepID=A0A7W7MW37_9ACTN|nr:MULTISPECIES: DUF4232 domain-containing protein [Actinomadura]MBB4773213.1 hypothetical protein [Actinomadura catellatispora]GGU18816.1 hypothetical protein GCM10010208_50010 [Actinomadura livida]
MGTPLPKIIWGPLAAAAVATALAGCGPAENAGPAAAEAGGPAPPAGSTTAGAPGSGTGTEPGSPGTGAPSGTPSAVDAPTTGPPGGGKAGGPGGEAPAGEAPGVAGAGAGGPRCTGAMLSASLINRYFIETNRYVTLVLTNTSGTTCTVRGWSDLQLVNAAGLVHTNVLRHGTPQTVTLPSGGRAYERLYWTSETAADEGVPCRPTANALKIVPPDETRQLEAPWLYGAVCQHGDISLTPLTANPTGG